MIALLSRIIVLPIDRPDLPLLPVDGHAPAAESWDWIYRFTNANSDRNPPRISSTGDFRQVQEPIFVRGLDPLANLIQQFLAVFRLIGGIAIDHRFETPHAHVLIVNALFKNYPD